MEFLLLGFESLEPLVGLLLFLSSGFYFVRSFKVVTVPHHYLLTEKGWENKLINLRITWTAIQSNLLHTMFIKLNIHINRTHFVR